MPYRLYASELYHHGIKGQKWGVRRFQDSSGKLTTAGKKRYKEYKQDYKEYKTLNRHVSAAQRHLKEEGVMLDRVRDKYQQADRNYRKEMMKSSGLFGLKAAKKADRVARAQKTMDDVGKDYDVAANSYGYANKIAKKDRKALSDHINKMVGKYGEGSVKEIEYETVKIGQNKLQKIMQGAPVSSIFGRSRETDVYVKTGKTVADMPIVGNWYTANYTSNEEWKIKRSEIERTRDSSSAKRKSGDKVGKYINDKDYFNGASSVGKTKREREAEKKTEAKAEKKAKAKAEKKAKIEARDKAWKEQKEAEKEHKKKVKQIRRSATKAYKETQKEHEDNVRRGTNVKKYIRYMGHSATFNIHYSDELYHYGVLGMKWGVHKAVGYATDVNKHRYKQKVKALEGKQLTKEEYAGAKAKYKQELQNANKKAYKQIGKTSIDKTKKVSSIYQKYKDQAINEIPHYKLKKAAKVTGKVLAVAGVLTVGVVAGAGFNARAAKNFKEYQRASADAIIKLDRCMNSPSRINTKKYAEAAKKVNDARNAYEMDKIASTLAPRSAGITAGYLSVNQFERNNELVDNAREENKKKK